MAIELLEFFIVADQSEDPHYVAVAQTNRGRLETLSEVILDERTLELKGLHIGGDPKVEWGWADLRKLARLIAENLDVDEIIVTGGVQTTGGNPGRQPKQWRIRRTGSS